AGATRAALTAVPTCITCFWPTKCWGRRYCRCTMWPSTAGWWLRLAGLSRSDGSRRFARSTLPAGKANFKIPLPLAEHLAGYSVSPLPAGERGKNRTRFQGYMLMHQLLFLLAQQSSDKPPAGPFGDSSNLLLMVGLFAAFYFIILMPMKRREKK